MIYSPELFLGHKAAASEHEQTVIMPQILPSVFHILQNVNDDFNNNRIDETKRRYSFYVFSYHGLWPFLLSCN